MGRGSLAHEKTRLFNRVLPLSTKYLLPQPDQYLVKQFPTRRCIVPVCHALRRVSKVVTGIPAVVLMSFYHGCTDGPEPLERDSAPCPTPPLPYHVLTWAIGPQGGTVRRGEGKDRVSAPLCF